MVVASLLRYFSALLLSDSFAASFRFVFSLGDRHLFALLPGHLVAHLPGHLSLNLVLDSLAFLFRFVLRNLFVFSLAFFLVFSMTGLPCNLLALFPWNILALLSGYTVALLLWYLLAHLSRLVVTLLLGHYRGNWLLNLVAFRNWHRTTDRLVNSFALFMILVVSVWNLDSVAFLSRFIPALLLWNLLASSLRFIPALLSRLIPTLLLTVDIATLLLSDSRALPDCSRGAGLFIGSAALALSSSVTLLLISVFGNRFLNIIAVLLRGIMALLLSL